MKSTALLLLIALLGLLIALLGSVPTAQAQTGTVEGQVTNAETGEPLPGVNVRVVDTPTGTATGAEGRYSLSVAPGTYDVRASFVGYTTKTTEDVSVESGATVTVDFGLQAAAVGLEQLVVVGYGEQQKKDLTGAVSSVSEEEIQRVPVTSVDQALQGRAAGVQVNQGSLGEPGAGATVRIRGSNSINAGNGPLYVVDGFPISGGLSTINPGDIESIEILKDASATAIYGARGSNGVVLITTKGGEAGQSNVSFRSYLGQQQVRKKLDLLNAEEWARYANEAYRNDGLEPLFPNPEEFGAGTDWQDVLFRPALQQNYQLSFSGGDEKTRYAVTGSYFDKEGIVEGSGFWRGSFRLNLTRDVTDRLQVGGNLSASRVSQENLTGVRRRQPVIAALRVIPLTPVRDEEGNYVKPEEVLQERFGLEQRIVSDNPLALALEPTDLQRTDRFLGNFSAEYALWEQLNVKTTLGVDYRTPRNETYIPTTLTAGENVGGSAAVSTSQNLLWLNENTVNYSNTLAGRHQLDVLAGFTIQESRHDGLNASAEGFVSDFFRASNLDVASNPLPPSDGTSRSSLISYLGRVNYTLDDTYLFTLTGRADGSSRFGAGNKYGFFPSGAVAWRLSEEGFVQDLGVFSDLKLRASYGVVGNQAIGNFQSLARLGSDAYPFGGNRKVGFAPVSAPNPDLKWERTEELNIGLDAGFWGNRLTLTANYYTKTTTDLLLGVTLPGNTGYNTSLQNVGSVKNEGLELSVDLESEFGSLYWNGNANVSTNKNEVVKLSQDEDIIVNGAGGIAAGSSGITSILREGHPIGSFYTFTSLGLWESQEEIDEVGTMPNALPGDERYEDVNGDGIISPEDRTIVGHGRPDVVFGLSNTFRLEGIDLSVFLQGSYGNEIFDGTNQLIGNPRAATGRNLGTRVLDEESPRSTTEMGGSPLLASDRWIEDGSYLRVQDVTLGYTLPSNLLSIGVREIRVYASAQNLLTLTGYEGYDPEVNRFGGEDTRFGYDESYYPNTKTYTVGLNLNL